MSELDAEIAALEELIRRKEQQYKELAELEAAPEPDQREAPPTPPLPAPSPNAWARNYSMTLRERQEEEAAMNRPPVNQVYRRRPECTTRAPCGPSDWSRSLRELFPGRR